ncbi:MAG: glutaminase [Arthrobacter sp.]|uniref:glutaminase n=1 Tax=Arthrobacter sp. TaxID=1667 RepID=UPI0034891D15
MADDIPPLAAVSPDTPALAVTNVNGRTHAAGYADVEFSILLVSKQFASAAAVMGR